LLIAQPKQVAAHDPNPLPKTNQDRIVRAQKLMSSDPSFRKRQRGCLGHAATLCYPSPLVKPGVPISGTREIQLNCSLAVLEWRVK
jgi:hypothetical protein